MSMENSGSAYYGLLFPIRVSGRDEEITDNLERIKEMVESVGLEVDWSFTLHEEIRDVVVGKKLDGLNKKQIIEAMDKVIKSFSQAITSAIEVLLECKVSSDVFGVHIAIDLEE